MKGKLILIILSSMVLLSCREERKIEIVPNLESEYLSESEIDSPAELISDTSPHGLSSSDALINAIKSIHSFPDKDSLRYIIKLRVYINENGVIDKIRDISNTYDRADYSADGVRNYTERKKMNEALAKELNSFKFNPAKKQGSNIKSYIDVTGVNVLAIPGGKFIVELPEFLSGLFSSKDKYLTIADEMPEIIGGLYSLQKKIKYPEVARRAGIEGRVYVLAMIDENGKVTDAKIIKGIGAGCNEAALEAVKAVSFTPGRNNGRPVKVQVTIPIMFKLQ